MREHFATEEAMMKAAATRISNNTRPNMQGFRARLEELQLKSIGEDISTDTVQFLTHWLTNHIAKTDLAYVPYLKR
jgi:hemerythrin-like metal-binding protein